MLVSHLEESHVIPALIHKCLLAKRGFLFLPLHPYLTHLIGNNTPFIVFGSGRPLRQFIYSYDIAKLFVWQLREYNETEPVILSGMKPNFVSAAETLSVLFPLQSGRMKKLVSGTLQTLWLLLLVSKGSTA